MERFTGWLKEHPILSGVLVLAAIFLFVILRRGGGSQPVSSGPSEALQAAQMQAGLQQAQIDAASNANTQGLNAALAAKGLDTSAQMDAIHTLAQAQTDQAVIGAGSSNYQASLAADVANHQTTASLTASLAATDASLALGTTQANDALQGLQAQYSSATDIAQINATGATDIAGIQADVTKAGFAEDLSKQRDIDAASIAINGQNTSRDVSVAGINADVAKTGFWDSLQAVLSNNATATAINDSNNQTAIAVTQIGANRDVTINGQNTSRDVDVAQITSDAGIANTKTIADLYSQLIDAQHDIANNQISATSTLQENLLQDFHTTDFNRGGQGGANQVAAWSALFGQPTVGAAAEQAGGGGFNWGNLLTGIGNLLGGAGKVVAAV